MALSSLALMFVLSTIYTLSKKGKFEKDYRLVETHKMNAMKNPWRAN